MDNGKTVRETRDADVPLVVRHFYNHAGWAQLMDTQMADQQPVGVVAQVIPWNFPLLMLAWKIAPALAMGNTLVLKPAPATKLTALLFCQILEEVGLPEGVVNVVCGDNDMAAHLATHEGIDKLAFTGSTPVGKWLRDATAGSGVKLSLELGGKSPAIVFDSADLDSAIEGIVNAIFFNQGQVCCAGSRLLVQESIQEEFLAKLRRRMDKLRVGDSLDKCMDMGAIVDQTQRDRIATMVESGRAEGGQIYQSQAPEGCFYPPTLITELQSSSTLIQNEIFGPVLVTQSFRTPEEALALANNSRFGLSASVWTENIGLGLEMATRIKAGVVWVNSHNLFDAAAGFGGYKESGYGREGGKEGLYGYTRPKWQSRSKPKLGNAQRDAAWGVEVAPLPSTGAPVTSFPSRTQSISIDRTPKMYIGGKQKRPDGAYSLPIKGHDGKLVGQVGAGNRKDIRDAVEAAHKASSWGKRAAHDRAQIMYYMAENLHIREREFACRIADMTGCTEKEGVEEVQASISRLFSYAGWADKYGGTVQETPLYGFTAAINEPVGVIGMVCPEKNPLLGFISLVAPAVVRGNTVVVVPSSKHPLLATDLYQVLETSDLPGGVINIVTGQSDVLAKPMSMHQRIDSLWYFGDAVGSYHVEKESARNMKRTFVSYGSERDWFNAEQGEGEEFLREASQVKNIWVPFGE